MIPARMIPYTIPVTFAGLTIYAWQDAEVGYTVSKNETITLTGKRFVTLSKEKSTFPRSFDCYTEDFSDISALAEKIGYFDSLTFQNQTFTDCYISGLDKIKEIVRGSGKWSFSIEFGKADVY